MAEADVGVGGVYGVGRNQNFTYFIGDDRTRKGVFDGKNFTCDIGFDIGIFECQVCVKHSAIDEL